MIAFLWNDAACMWVVFTKFYKDSVPMERCGMHVGRFYKIYKDSVPTEYRADRADRATKIAFLWNDAAWTRVVFTKFLQR
jgi:hypothetical protein